MCVCLACGPTVSAGDDDDGSTGSTSDGSSSDGVNPDPSVADVTTGTTSTTSTTATVTTDGPLDTGDFGCPFEQCDISTYCDEATGECLPKPEVMPDCAPDRIALVEETSVDAATGILALGLADTDGVGARELVAVTTAGVVEIRTGELDPITTVDLGLPVSDAQVVGRAGDGFGRIWARAGVEPELLALTGDGAGGFDPTPLGFSGGAMTSDDLDGDDDSDLAIVLGDAVQLVVAGDTVDLGASIDLGFAARSLGTARGAAGVDLLVGSDTALLRLPADGAGGFGNAEVIELLHVADRVDAFGNDSTAGTFSLGLGDDASLSLTGGSDEAWRWLLSGTAVIHPAAVGVYGDPGSIADVLLLGGPTGVTIIVEPHRELPCQARLGGPDVRAILPAGSSPIVARDGVLTRMSLQ